MLGDNGAGKSTFIKILAGAHEHTAGKFVVDGISRMFAHRMTSKLLLRPEDASAELAHFALARLCATPSSGVSEPGSASDFPTGVCGVGFVPGPTKVRYTSYWRVR